MERGTELSAGRRFRAQSSVAGGEGGGSRCREEQTARAARRGAGKHVALPLCVLASG